MNNLKKKFLLFLSSGTHGSLIESKRYAIQITNVDMLITFLILFFYFLNSTVRGYYPLNIFQLIGAVLAVFSYWLINKRYYDAGRFLNHFNGLALVFVTADAYPQDSSFELYYMIGVLVPFVTFSLEEHKKGLFLSIITMALLMLQMYLGPGLFSEIHPFSRAEKVETLFIVFAYAVTVLSVARWQVNLAQLEIKRQQGELIHTSNLVALGELSGGIAHEINNPLQSLSLQSFVIKESVETDPQKAREQLVVMDRTIHKMAKMIKGLKDLTRDVSEDETEDFPVKNIIEDVMTVSSQKFNNLGIEIKVSGDDSLAVNGRVVHLSQVLMNLLNNAVDAIEDRHTKWIHLHINELQHKIELSVTDSGDGIPPHISSKIMQPFFTTKPAGKGTGLGLSISQSILEKNGGRLYYDQSAKNTRFVVEIPKSEFV